MLEYNNYTKIFENEEQFNSLIKKIRELISKKINLIVTDFDHTLFSQQEILEDDVRDGRRGEEGNEYIMKYIGVEDFIKRFYEGKEFPKDIVEQLKEGQDLILTLGVKELQEAKIKACNLENINHIVVSNAIDKIIELIKYVVFELKFIPSKITIYEDRPEDFIEYKKLLEEFIGCKIEIVLVEMDGNNGYIKLDKVA